MQIAFGKEDSAERYCFTQTDWRGYISSQANRSWPKGPRSQQ